MQERLEELEREAQGLKAECDIAYRAERQAAAEKEKAERELELE